MLTGNEIKFENRDVYHPSEKPTNYWSIAKKVAVRIVCPPILLWDGLKWGVNKLAGGAMAKLILPAASDLDCANELARYKGEEKLKETITDELFQLPDKNFPNKNNLAFQPLTLHTEDKAKLNALEFSYFEPKKHIKSEKYIINFLGNAECYEHKSNINQMLKDAMRYQCNVIGFNYRGVNDSLGKPKESKNKKNKEYLKATSTQELVNDGLTLVQSLLDKKIKPEDIILNGHSLGGAIASIVGDYCHRHGIPVRVMNGRSISTATRFAVGKIRAAGKNRHDKHSLTAILKKNVFKALGYIAMPFIKLGLALTKWEIDAARAFKRIPGTHKEYWLVRSDKAARNPDPKEENKIIPKDDTIVPHWSSLYRDSELREERRESKKCTTKIIKYYLKKIKIEEQNNGSMISTYEKEIARAIDDENRAINTRKMIVNDQWKEGHWAKNHELNSRYQEIDQYGDRKPQSANDFFENFFNRSPKSKSQDSSKKNHEHSSENLSQVNLMSGTEEDNSYDHKF